MLHVSGAPQCNLPDMFGFNLLTWLDDHSGSVSAITTIILAGITAWYALTTQRAFGLTETYVKHTEGLLDAARAERQDRLDREVSGQARLASAFTTQGQYIHDVLYA